MNPLIVPIVAIACTCWTIVTVYRIKHEGNSTANDQTDDQPQNSELKQQVNALTKRVEALETIITENSYDLKHEINRL
ncbi:MAG: hypothetical protein ACI9FJ_001777 [Alteromonadaceae bacterium]|jgi:hypothetical protein